MNDNGGVDRDSRESGLHKGCMACPRHEPYLLGGQTVSHRVDEGLKVGLVQLVDQQRNTQILAQEMGELAREQVFHNVPRCP
jgi:hypothetical protein